MNTDQIILEHFIKNHPQQAVIVLEEFKEEEIIAFLEAGPPDRTISIISSMSSYKAARHLEKLNIELVLTILEHLDFHLKRTILRQSGEGFRNQILDSMPPKKSAVLKQNLTYATGTTGFLMNPLLLSFTKGLTVKETIIIAKNEKENISSNIVIVDDQGKPEGIIRLSDLLFAESSMRLSDLMKTEFPKFYADESIESIKNHPGWHEHQTIPVIDRYETLIGTLDFRSIGESQPNKGEQNRNIIATSNAIGELYRIGLTGILQSVSK